MPKAIKRDDELRKRRGVKKCLGKLVQDIKTGFRDQNQRANDILDYWDIYNCELSGSQFYYGTSQIFVPMVHDAIVARKTRFVNQIFPKAGRYVECITENADIPFATISLMEHYVRRAKLRTQVLPAMQVAGDVEGQYSLYCDWKKSERSVTRRVLNPVEVEGLEMPEFGEVEDQEDEVIADGHPFVEVIADSDLLVLPVTADSIDEAIDVGGSVTVVRRWSAQKLKEMRDAGELPDDYEDGDLDDMAGVDGTRSRSCELADAAGINLSESKQAAIFEVWTQVDIGEDRRLCRVFVGADEEVLSVKLCPYWCDRVPVISAPVEKIGDMFKGVSQVKKVSTLQYLANDTINEGADTAHFSAMPIVMTDPTKNPRVSSMVLGLAAIWETSPKDTQFAQFPQLWADAWGRAQAIQTQIFQTLGVNPAMVPQSSGKVGTKRNQAEVANEQAVDLLTTADAVSTIEEGILTPLIERFLEYDHQFRSDAVLIRSYGEMGLRARMEEIEPIQINRRYELRWFGVEAARNAAQVQQQIAAANVINGIDPAKYQGYRINMAPLLVQLSENAFGPRLAPLVFEDLKSQLSVDPKLENEMLESGFPVSAHLMDDDALHMKVHMEAMRQGDPHGTVRVHMLEHQMQIQMKTQAMMAQQQPQPQPGLPGVPGGAGPGVPGTPRPGAQVDGPRGVMQQPAGAIPEDQMPRAGVIQMPRKM